MGLTEQILSVAARLALATDKQELLKLAAELGSISASTVNIQETYADEKCTTGFLKFTQKEIMRMPKRFSKIFRAEGCTAHVRKRKSGKGTTNYEIRYRKHGYDIAVSSNNLDEAKDKFIEALHAADNAKGETRSVPRTFSGFVTFYFENYRKRKVSPQTYTNDWGRVKNHLLPHFGDTPISRISLNDCQTFLDEKAERSTKTSKELFSLLNCTFKYAVRMGIIARNPLDAAISAQHSSTHGTAFTKEEEKILLEQTAGTRYQLMFAVILYTGLRPSEYRTARIKGKFIVAQNKKRKGGKVEYKKIPISPMLRPYLVGVSEIIFANIKTLSCHLKNVLPNHIPYDLRTTFYTRCEECGVSPPARDEFVGHSEGKLHDAYTDLPDEYLLTEGEKLTW